MTIHMKNFGTHLITRQAAKGLLKSVILVEPPVLDFAGVKIANHPFMDELGKGIAAQVHLSNLHSVKVENSNSYIDRSAAAGFATACQAA